MNLYFLESWGEFGQRIINLITNLERTLGGGRARELLDGLWITIQISLGAMLIGIIIGSFIAACKLSKYRFPRAVAFIYLGVIRGTPAVTQLLIVSATIFATARGAPLRIGIVALGINSGAYVAEIIRAGIMSIDKGQTEAGLSLGLSKSQTLVFIVMPQAIKNILPTFINEFIVLIKETAIVGFVAIRDVTRVANLIMSRTMEPTPLFVSAAMYLIVISILTMLLGLLEKRLRKADTPRIKSRKRLDG